MKLLCENHRFTNLSYEKLFTGGRFNEQLTTPDILRAVGTRLPKSSRATTCCDYSEEAIPERDPAYHLPHGTDNEEPTIEAVSAEGRLDLARRLQQLGMSPGRAAAVASL
jgi:hypothetical protein